MNRKLLQTFWLISLTAFFFFLVSCPDVWRRRHGLERRNKAAPRGDQGRRDTGVLPSCSIVWPQASHSTSAWLPLLGCTVIGRLFVVWATTKHPQGHHSLGVITRSPTPTFCVGWAVTFRLIILNQITCVCQKSPFQKGFWALSEDRISHTNLFSFLSVCSFLLCWIVVRSSA